MALGGAVACNSSAAPCTPDLPPRTGGGWLIGTVLRIRVFDSTSTTVVDVHPTDGRIDPGNQDHWVYSAFAGAAEVHVVLPGTTHAEIQVGEKIEADCWDVSEGFLGEFFRDCTVTILGTS